MDELTFYTLQICLLSFYLGWKYKSLCDFFTGFLILILPIVGLLGKWIEIIDKYSSKIVAIWMITIGLLGSGVIYFHKRRYPSLFSLMLSKKEVGRLTSIFIIINVFYWTIRSLNIYWSILITGISTLGWLLLIKRLGGTSFIDRKIKECKESESWKKFCKGVVESEEVPPWAIKGLIIGGVILGFGVAFLIPMSSITLILIGVILELIGGIVILSILFYFFGRVLYLRYKNKAK